MIYDIGTRLKNRTTGDIWEITAVNDQSNEYKIKCISSTVPIATGAIRLMPYSALEERIAVKAWVVSENIVPVVSPETQEKLDKILNDMDWEDRVSSLVNDFNSTTTASNMNAESTALDKAPSAILPFRPTRMHKETPSPTSPDWACNTVIIEEAKGTYAHAKLKEMNPKYLLWEIQNPGCNIKVFKYITSEIDYILLLTSPDEYWDRHIKPFMDKHFG